MGLKNDHNGLAAEVQPIVLKSRMARMDLGLDMLSW